ncbi:Zinc finger and BTB domain-containing protein 44, partial [Trachymyrmex cornetzi]
KLPVERRLYVLFLLLLFTNAVTIISSPDNKKYLGYWRGARLLGEPWIKINPSSVSCRTIPVVLLLAQPADSTGLKYFPSPCGNYLTPGTHWYTKTHIFLDRFVSRGFVLELRRVGGRRISVTKNALKKHETEARRRRTVKTRFLLKEHILSHNKIKPCKYCSKRYKRPWSLKMHKYWHTGLKRFKCAISARYMKAQFANHIRTHCSWLVRVLKLLFVSHGSGSLRCRSFYIPRDKCTDYVRATT